jgi:hypothetical protein
MVSPKQIHTIQRPFTTLAALPLLEILPVGLVVAPGHPRESLADLSER